MSDDTENPPVEQAEVATPGDEPSTPEPSEQLHGVPVTRPRGETVLHPSAEQYLDTVTSLRADGYLQLVDLCAVDYLTHIGRTTLPDEIAPQRFEVVVQLRNIQTGDRVRVRVQLPGRDPCLPSLFTLYPGTEALEREALDMFGIEFEAHPDPTRILMPESWQGHPLRKDYPVGEIPVQFKAAGSAR